MGDMLKINRFGLTGLSYCLQLIDNFCILVKGFALCFRESAYIQ